MTYHLNVVRGSVRANGRLYIAGETLTVENEDAASALLDTGAVVPRDKMAEATMEQISAEAARHDRDVLLLIGAVVDQVDGVPRHLLLAEAVKWMADELAAARIALAQIKATDTPEPPAEAEPEPKDTPEAQAPDGPKDQPDPEPEPDPAKDAPKKRGK